MTALLSLAPSARRTFLRILYCAAAADGDVSTDEQAALRGAQVAFGLVDDPLPAQVAFSDIDVATLSPRERKLAVTAAVWMTLADGVRSRSESAFLWRLRDHLGVGADDARFMASHARWVRTSTDLSWHRELDLLLTEGARRIDRVERARAAA